MTRLPFFQKLSLFLFLSLFVCGGAKVNAAVIGIRWYENPIPQTCTYLTPATSFNSETGTYDIISGVYDPAFPSGFPAGWTLESEYVEGGDGGSSYRLKACPPGVNDTNNPVGAQASYGASTDKEDYQPGEKVTIHLAAVTGSRGDVIGGYVFSFLNYIDPIAHGVICFLFGCSTPPAVSVEATLLDSGVQFKKWAQDMGDLSLCTEHEADPFEPWYSITCPYSEIDNGTSYAISNSGGTTGNAYFLAPVNTGTHQILVRGCYEWGGCVDALLFYTVGMSAPLPSGAEPKVFLQFASSRSIVAGGTCTVKQLYFDGTSWTTTGTWVLNPGDAGRNVGIGGTNDASCIPSGPAACERAGATPNFTYTCRATTNEVCGGVYTDGPADSRMQCESGAIANNCNGAGAKAFCVCNKDTSVRALTGQPLTCPVTTPTTCPFLGTFLPLNSAAYSVDEITPIYMSPGEAGMNRDYYQHTCEAGRTWSPMQETWGCSPTMGCLIK